MKLKFNQDAYINGEHTYAKDQVYEISDELGSASRWVRRGMAEVVVETPEPKEETKPRSKPSPKSKKAEEIKAEELL